MKYAPRHNPFRNINYKSKKQLQIHLDFVKLNPDDKEKPYYCAVCNKRFLTELGASNHVDFVHTELVFNALMGTKKIHITEKDRKLLHIQQREKAKERERKKEIQRIQFFKPFE